MNQGQNENINYSWVLLQHLNTISQGTKEIITPGQPNLASLLCHRQQIAAMETLLAPYLPKEYYEKIKPKFVVTPKKIECITKANLVQEMQFFEESSQWLGVLLGYAFKNNLLKAPGLVCAKEGVDLSE